MSNMSEDIQYAGSDTRPPMLDRTDFESWQQRIRLYCLGKDNGENIMKSITEVHFQWDVIDILPKFERIEMTKRSKNSQKPTRNRRDKTRVKKQPKIKAGSARHSRKDSQRKK
ncbi:hypothetical protein Tco_0163869 [Tanacetum coccineum]